MKMMIKKNSNKTLNKVKFLQKHEFYKKSSKDKKILKIN